MATKKAAPKKAMKKAAPKKAAKPMMKKPMAAPPMAATPPPSMGGSAPMMMKKGGKTMKKAQNGLMQKDSVSSYKASKPANEWFKDRQTKSTGYKAPVQNPQFEIMKEKDSMKKNIRGAKRGTTMKKCKYGC